MSRSGRVPAKLLSTPVHVPAENARTPFRTVELE
ncbi:hypothetical protein SSAG_05617 [Streptomyces sp. Mg1]|nr:hypothetical protein SSAG_05617 [Streptomyces sp. Mg1]